MKPDTRFLSQPELRAVTNEDGTITFEGYAAVFNSESCDLGGFIERIDPNAFTRCFRDKSPDIRCLQNHDSSRVLGRTTARSLRLWTDSKGLAFSVRSQPTSYARDLALNVDAKEVSGCSFRFYCAEGGDKWESKPDGRLIRTLVDVEIDEVSIVTFPAYLATEVSTRSQELREAATRSLTPTEPATKPAPPTPADLAQIETAHRRRLARIAAVAP